MEPIGGVAMCAQIYFRNFSKSIATKCILVAISLTLVFWQATASAQNIVSLSPVKPLSAYDWSGFYLGGHLGYGWQTVNETSRLNLASGVIGPSWSYHSSGALGGLQVGYNVVIKRSFLVGLETDFSAANIDGGGINPEQTAYASTRVRWFGSVRGRVGYLFNNSLLYGTGGLAWLNGDAHRQQIAGSTNNARNGTVESLSYSKLGWTLGGGLETPLTYRATVKLEYLYLASFDKIFVTWPLAQTQPNLDLHVQTIRLGLNFKF